jgi:prepilin-type N-terminal cleavage/methylation domain-containing protein
VRPGFSLIELLIVIAIIAVLAGIFLPTLGPRSRKNKIAVCMNNLRQINLATHMYSDDHQDAIVLPSGASGSATDYQLYKETVKSYLGYKGKASPDEKLFACPSDKFYYTAGNGSGAYHNSGLCRQSITDFTSYAFNGGNRSGTNFPGLAGVRLTSVRNPARTALILEAAALTPFSWHQPIKAAGDYRVPDSMNMVSFVDGHASRIRMYCDTNSRDEAWQQNPPSGYNYQWSAD